MTPSVLTVSALNFYIKSVFDGDPNLLNVFVEGEISNFKNHYSSGHLYFSIKDDKSVIKCVMFNRAASRLKFAPENSMKVVIRGRVAVYERDGQYQIYCEDMQPLGAGALAIAFEQLKEKLGKEGLFNTERKRPLPKRVNRIAVLTSNTGAAIQDIISVAERRNPFVELVVCPVLVQGEGAAISMIQMLDKVYNASGIDAIIIGRGGGSIEDLWCFNEEALVRKIYQSPIPVVSAVGHETDFTLCDFVSDLRAPTPSAAAEILVPDILTKIADSTMMKKRISDLCRNLINVMYERLDRALQSNVFFDSKITLKSKNDTFVNVFDKFYAVSRLNFNKHESNTNVLFKKLETLNPISVMSRGFSLAYNENGEIANANNVKTDSKLTVKFIDGTANCKVIDVSKE